MLVMQVGHKAGLTPIARNLAEQIRQITQAEWSIASPSSAAEIHLSQSVKYAACLQTLQVGVARITCKVLVDGKDLEQTLDVQVVVQK